MKSQHIYQSTAKVIAAMMVLMLALATLPVIPANAAAPTATTVAATALRRTGAQVNGTVNAGSETTTVTFEYGLTAAYGSTVTATQSPLTGSTNTTVNFMLSGLTPNTTYHYRVVAVNGSGTSYGADMSFTTLVLSPTTYYVDHTNAACNDAGTGTTPAVPFCTIGQGAAIADAGDTVRVLTPSTSYTYPETVRPNNNGGAGIPITFSAEPGVTVTGNGTATGSGFRVANKIYITIDGFNVTNATDEGIYVLGSDHITISNNHVSYSGDAINTHKRGIWLNSTTNSLIDHNTTDHNSCIGIRLVYSDYNTVSNNISFANESVAVTDAAGIELTGSSHNTVIHNITYGNEDTGINVYVHASGQGSNDNFIIGNLSYGNHDHGIDANGSTNATIVGNTVQGNYTSGINIEATSTGSTIMNNIVADNGLNPSGGRKPYNIYIDSTSVAGTTLDYNHYYLTSPYTLEIDWNGVAYTLAAFKLAVPGQEVNGFEGNPLFFAPAAPATEPFVIATGDYHLTAGSPAIDSANSNAPSEPLLDLDGNNRVDDALVANTGAGVRTYDDRGAYEYLPSVDQTITFTSTAPAGAIYGGPTYTPTATATSGLPVIITVDGTASTVCSITGGVVSFIGVGLCILDANQPGNAYYNPAPQVQQSFTVGKADTSTTITSDLPDPSVVGQAVTINFTVTVTAPGAGSPTGDVTVSDGAISCTGTVAVGSCSLTFTTPGARSLTATYTGNTNFNGSASATAAHTVNQADTTTTINSDTPDPSVTGQTVAVSFSVVADAPGAGTPTGTVTVTDSLDGISCNASVLVGTCNLTFPNAGARTLTAVYAGDANFAASTSIAEPHNVFKATTTTIITSDAPDASVVGQPVTVNFSVAVSPSGAGTPTGDVTVSDGTVSCTGAVAVGSCTLALTTAGARNLTATYAGDANFNGSTSAAEPHTVNKADTTTTITSDLPEPSVVGEAVTVSFGVAASAPGAGTPSGNVTVSDGAISCTGTVAVGSCNLTFTTPGARSLTATYAGDTNFNGSTSATVGHTVNQASTTTTINSDLPDPSVVGQAVTVNFTVAVVAPGAGTPTGNVTITDDLSAAFCSADATAGTCNITFTTAGARNLTATYIGDTNFATSTSATVGHTVNQAGTTTTITSDLPDPSAFGQVVPVYYTVVVNGPGAGTPTGTVTVTDSISTANCSDSVGAGFCNILFPTPGARSLTASYGGDTNFAASTSGTESHNVIKADTTTTITSDLPDSSMVGQAVTVNFGVAVSPPGAGTLTGDVTITDSISAASCTASVAAGTCNITFLTAGLRNLTATYIGDTNFNGSASAAEPHTVNLAATTTVITLVGPEPSVVGQAVTVNWSVVVTAPGVGTPTGNVTVSDGVVSCNATVATGFCNLTFTSVGPLNLTATYAGDANFAGSASASVPHDVNQAATTTTITSDTPDPSFVGQAVTVNFTVVAAAPGAGTPTGNVTITDSASLASCTGTVATGTCSITFTTSGARNLTATYVGDTNFATSASAVEPHNVNKGATTVTIVTDLPDPSYAGSPVTVTFNVVPVAPAVGTPSGNVTVTDGVNSCFGTVAAGSCSITLNTVGIRLLIATYAGDANFAGSASLPVTHTVNPLIAPAITSAPPAAGTVNNFYTHTFTATGSPPPTFSLTGAALPAGLTFNGVDTISGTPTTAGTSGSITVTAANGVLPDATQAFTITINQATTTTAITSDTPDPSQFGAPVPVNFTVTGQFGNAPTAPTGSVTITDSLSAASCFAPASAGTCNITFTSLGTRNLTATYAGDANFTGSASATVAHDVVQAGTTTAITSDLPDPSNVGSAVTVNFTVTVNAPGTGTPTGFVTIADSASPAGCSAPVATGSCSITFTTVGAHNLTATYSGDTNFAGSASAAEPHAVNPISSTVTTNAATGMNTTSATLHATVNANFDSTAVTFEYGLTAAYGSVVAGVPSPVTGNTNTAVSAAITGLIPNTLYHFRAIGLNSAGTTYGADLTFSTTPIVYPIVASSVPANNATLSAGPTQLIVNYNKDVLHDGSANAANNVINYHLVGVGANSVFNTLSCLGGLAGDDVNFVINTAVYDNNGGAGPFRATLGINGAVPLPVGTYRLFVCGTTSVRDDEGYILNNGVDGEVTFTVVAPLPLALPATGFAPNRTTLLPAQPADKAYAALGSLWMEIPSLSVKMNIVGVPQTTGDWDVSWLGRQAGWLQGTAYPTWVGNSVVTAHVTDANGKNGPFAALKNLKYGDQIIVHMNGQKYTYEVRNMREVTPNSTSYVFQKLEKYSYLTLLTCKDYNPLTNKYAARDVVRAVLVSITTDK